MHGSPRRRIITKDVLDPSAGTTQLQRTPRANGDKPRPGPVLEWYTHSVCLIDVYDTSGLVGSVGLRRAYGNRFCGEGVRKACITPGGHADLKK